MNASHRLIYLAFLALVWLSGCASSPSVSLRETVVAVTDGMELIRFKADQPAHLLERKSITGLIAGDKLSGIDFRVARGVLYAIADTGRLYILDTAIATLKPVNALPPQPWPLVGKIVGFDFNPTVDRIRVVSDSGQNMRLHPDTGAVVDSDLSQPGLQIDTALHFVRGDINSDRAPALAGVAYTYNKQNDKLTTNYAIDRALGALLMQGSAEGATPVISPNTGQLRTVGLLGIGSLAEAHFDISDVANTALITARTLAGSPTRLYMVDLVSGHTKHLGTVGKGERLLGMAIEP